MTRRLPCSVPDRPPRALGTGTAAVLLGLLLALSPPAAAQGGSWNVLPRPLEPGVDGSFTLFVARGERGTDEDELRSLGDAALQVLWNEGRLWMPADTDPRIEPPVAGLYLVATAPGAGAVGGQFAKTFVPVGRPASGQQVWRSRLGHRLELVPELDPLAPRPDGRMPLVVFYDGRPLANVVVTALPRGGSLRDHRRATSDATGLATLELDRGGWWLVRVMHMSPGGEILGAALALPPPAGG